MGRMSKEKFQHAKRLFDGETGRALIAHCETIELELKISKEDEQRALDAMNRLMDNVAQLSAELKSVAESRDHYHKEREELRERIAMKDETIEAYQKQNEELRESKKASLPKEVAEAIEFYVGATTLNGVNVLYNPTEIERLGKIPNNNRAAALAEYIFNKGYNTYFLALINGYTVEKTKEDRLREGVSDIIETHYPFMANDDVASKVIDFVTKFNAEN